MLAPHLLHWSSGRAAPEKRVGVPTRLSRNRFDWAKVMTHRLKSNGRSRTLRITDRRSRARNSELSQRTLRLEETERRTFMPLAGNEASVRLAGARASRPPKSVRDGQTRWSRLRCRVGAEKGHVKTSECERSHPQRGGRQQHRGRIIDEKCRLRTKVEWKLSLPTAERFSFNFAFPGVSRECGQETGR